MAPVHEGSWTSPITGNKIKDYGVTEGIQWALNLLPGVDTPRTDQGGSDLNRSYSQQPSSSQPQVLGTDVYGPPAPDKNTQTKPPATGGGNGGNGGNTGDGNNNTNTLIDNAAKSQEDAARAAAEAARQAAMRKYQAKVGIANTAKGAARGEYNWLIDTLGSNKKDLLDQVNFNEQKGLTDYGTQETKTKDAYDKARAEILSTYRDLNTQQEKIMRGSGMASSSRSQEAALRLNNLLGKDMSSVSTNEADSLALIANAISSLQEQTRLTRNQIETETTSKLDKAALDYNNSIKAIDANLQLDANAREDEYANAETKLAQDIASIQTWASGLKLQVQQATANTQAALDNFIVDMTDQNGLLNTDLSTKETATNKLLTDAGYTPLDTEQNLQDPNSGVYQSNKSYKTKEELDAALQNGDITPLDYQKQLASIQSQGSGVLASAPSTGMGSQDLLSRVALGTQAQPTTQASSRIVGSDKLLSSILA